MTTKPPVPSKSLSEFMRQMPAIALEAADAARARARETGTPIVIMRDGKLVHEYEPPPIAEELRNGTGDVKRA
jgi:hypothetical protein